MFSLFRSRQILVLLALTIGSAPVLQAQPLSVAAILSQAREATGGSAWDRIAELRRDGTVTVAGKNGTIAIIEDLCTGANIDRVVIEGQRVEHHAMMPLESWDQDAVGDVSLTPESKKPREIDDLYIHRNGWWQPNFGGANVSLLSPTTENGVTYDRIACKPSGGLGFTLSVDRITHFIAQIDQGDTTKRFSDFRRVEDRLILPFREQKGNAVITFTRVATQPQVDAADFRPPFRTDYTMPASGEVTVPAEGGLIFGMRINGQGPFRTVFDTGAVNIISAAFARRLHLKVEETPVHFGAIGGAIQVHTAHIDTVTIGDLVVRDQTFYVLDIPADAGEPGMLVGWELMRRFAVRVDFEHNQLTFLDGPHFHYSGDGEAVPLILKKDGNGAEIRAEADGVSGMFLLDTGNQIGLFLNSTFVNDHHFVASLGAHYKGYNGKGFGGPSPEAWFARLHTFQVGAWTVSDPVVRLQTQPDGPNPDAGNVGQSILKHFTVTVDCMRGVMYLEKTLNWNRREAFNRAGVIIDPKNSFDLVMTVLPRSPAELAGLRAGDRITSINRRKPSDDPDDPVFIQPPGTVLHLVVERNGATKSYEVKLADIL